MAVVHPLKRVAVLRKHALAACLMVLATAHAQVGDFVGIIYPVRDLSLSVHVAAVVDQVPVVVGQRVNAGQVILRQESRLQEAERERRRVIFQDASELESTEKRRRLIEGLVLDATALFERAGTVSRDEVTKLRLELEAATGRVEQLRQSKRREQVELDVVERELALRELRAPACDGSVLSAAPALPRTCQPPPSPSHSTKTARARQSCTRHPHRRAQ